MSAKFFKIHKDGFGFLKVDKNILNFLPWMHFSIKWILASITGPTHTLLWIISDKSKPILPLSIQPSKVWTLAAPEPSHSNRLTGNLWRTLVYQQSIILEFHQKQNLLHLDFSSLISFSLKVLANMWILKDHRVLVTCKNIQKLFSITNYH